MQMRSAAMRSQIKFVCLHMENICKKHKFQYFYLQIPPSSYNISDRADRTYGAVFNNMQQLAVLVMKKMKKKWKMDKIARKKVNDVRLYLKVILCASEHICSIVRYCFRSFKQL